jgi:hypothetical protein
MSSTAMFLICVSTELSKDQLDEEDRDVSGNYLLELDGDCTADADATERALDLFHEIVPISVLDDFSIDCRVVTDPKAIPADARKLDPNDSVARRLHRASL